MADKQAADKDPTSEAALQSTLPLLDSALGATNDGVLVVDDGGNIVKWNSKLLELWGIPDEPTREGRDDRLVDHVLILICSVVWPNGSMRFRMLWKGSKPSRTFCPSARSAKKSAMTKATGIRWKPTSPGTPGRSSAAASAPNAWRSVIPSMMTVRMICRTARVSSIPAR